MLHLKCPLQKVVQSFYPKGHMAGTLGQYHNAEMTFEEKCLKFKNSSIESIIIKPTSCFRDRYSIILMTPKNCPYKLRNTVDTLIISRNYSCSKWLSIDTQQIVQSADDVAVYLFIVSDESAELSDLTDLMNV